MDHSHMTKELAVIISVTGSRLMSVAEKEGLNESTFHLVNTTTIEIRRPVRGETSEVVSMKR